MNAEDYIPLVKKVARSFDYMNLGCLTVEDLEQAGYIGLMRAIQNYNPKYEFIPYASKVIRSYILDELLNTRTIRIPENIVKEYIKHRKEGSEAPEDLVHIMEKTGVSVSFEQNVDVFIGNDEDFGIEDMDLADKVKFLLEDLPVRERIIVNMRFGLDRPPRTLEEIGDVVGISYERVRQIEKEVLETLSSKDIKQV